MTKIEQVRKWLQDIGRKGGSVGKGTEARRELCRAAARERWRKWRENKSKAKP